MLSVLLIAALNTLGHVYTTHRHEEVTRTLSEKLWSQLQYNSTQSSLAKIQRSLYKWQAVSHTAAASFHTSTTQAARQQFQYTRHQSSMLYHKQQVSQIRRYQKTSCFPFAYVRSQYHAGMCNRLSSTHQLSSQYHNTMSGRDIWQQIRDQSQTQTQRHLMQEHCKRLQLASHAFHMQYWNMQCTRRLVYAVQLPVSLQAVLTLKLWSPQTAAEMPRSDPF